jgi:chemotaxis protein methyltransferase CheR
MNPSPDRFEHLTFLGDPPAPTVPVAQRAVPPRKLADEIRLGPDGAAFFEALCSGWGLRASRYRDSILSRRQAACLRTLRTSSPGEGEIIVARDPQASERALGAVMIGVTGFFRDVTVFDALRPLLRMLRQAPAPLRAMSVGCSDGSELYSLAILLAEEGLLGDSRLVGLDCRPAAIRSARAGVYSNAAVADINPGRRERFFVALARTGPARATGRVAASQVRVAEDLRAACEWLVADAFSLGCEKGEPGMDLIMCRNLAIYLKPDSATELLSRCVAQLRPGGLLITGKAERPSAEVRSVLQQVAPCIHRRT